MRFADAKILLSLCGAALLAFSTACGGGSGGHTAAGSTGGGSAGNTQAIVVNSGPDKNYANGVFTTVTVCAPGTSNCQNISGVLVDTGSFGLRILSSALGSLNSALPQQKTANGTPTIECAQFVNNVIWGPVKTADVAMAGEKASSVPIQVIDPSVAPIPAACKAIGPAEEDLMSLGANGILGIGFFISDCGAACATNSGNPGFYYSCAGSSCEVVAQSTTQQVQNPVALFSQDNNGVVVQLPAVSASAPSVSGSLVFGIGTQTDNALGSVQIFRPDNKGNLKTTFKGATYEGFLDSGSNAYFFLDSSAAGMPDCPSPESGFYCPSSPLSLTATNNSGSGSGATSTINFTVANANQLFSNAADFAFPDLGGPNPNTFDWGLPFFFGRNVFVAFEPPAGSGPYWAY
jgi:hypothetical protein